MEKILIREKKGNIEILTLNDPKKLNALSEEMLLSLEIAFEDISQDTEVKVVILRSSGKAFCAGHDLKEMQSARQSADAGKKYFNDLFKRCGRTMISITKMPQPVIASVDGIAAAAGCQLVATCDLAIASFDATFGVNGVNIGLFCSTPMVALSRNISKKKTFEMLITGDFLDADSARYTGLVNTVVSTHDLEKETFKIAKKINSKLSAAIKIGKEAFYIQSEMDLESAYTYTAEVMAKNMLFKDTNEGINAFIEKRSPEWPKN
jgi:enoyl-CoA hydratase/carnithine racemase